MCQLYEAITQHITNPRKTERQDKRQREGEAAQ
jgi:hypothetical protein